MRYFTFVQPKEDSMDPEYITMSEDEIRKEYYPYWKKQIVKVGKSLNDYCFEDCLDDWVITHWAWESTV